MPVLRTNKNKDEQMHYILCHLKKTLLVTGTIALASPIAIVSAVAQTEPPAATGEGATQTGQTATANAAANQVVLGDAVIDGDLIVTQSNVNVVVNGGTHAINGSVQINGSGDSMIIEFDEENGAGRMEINGSLILGPDNPPSLALDLSKVNLTSGAQFVIVDAAEVIGEFGGISNGTFTVGDYTLRIIYSKTSITVMVVGAPNRRLRIDTPVTFVDTDLIDPTSTSPSVW